MSPNTKSFYKQVVILVPSGSTASKISIDEQPQIRYARVTHIELLTASDLAFTGKDQVAVLPDANIPDVQFVFRTNDPDTKAEGEMVKNGRFTKNFETIQYIAASQLHRNQNSSSNSFVRVVPEWKNRYFMWNDSYVVISPGGLTPGTDIAIVLGVYYTFTDIDGKEIAPRN